MPLQAQAGSGSATEPGGHANATELAAQPTSQPGQAPWQIRAEDQLSTTAGAAANEASSLTDQSVASAAAPAAGGGAQQRAAAVAGAENARNAAEDISARSRGPRFAPVASSNAPESNVVPTGQGAQAATGTEALLGAGKAAGSQAASPLLPGSSRPQNQKRKKRTGRSIVAFLVVVLALGGLGYFGGKMAMDFFNSKPSAAVTDFPGPGTGEVNVVIPEGASGAAIANVLVDAGVTADVERTIAVLANHPDATSIQPGTYRLKLQMRADAAVAALMDPANRADTGLTIPEGYVLTQVKTRLVEIGGFDAAEVEAAMKDTAALGLPESAKGDLEGWLAPATYEVGPSDTPATLLKQMVDLQKSRLQAAGVPEADFQTVLIKASILEREVNIDEYLPKVARVIENRLKDADGETRGLLQMDSSVLYGLGQIGGVPTPEQLAIDTPYNTYMHKGLPPGPIASPGERAIQVALAPAEGTWLYFVTINLDTGETRFASTLEEHQQNVNLYRAYCETSDRC